MARKRRGGFGGGRKEKRSRVNGANEQEGQSSGNKPSGGDYTQIRMENPRFTEYYQALLDKEDFEASFAAFRTSLPAAVRINRSAPLWRATVETIHQLSLLSNEALDDCDAPRETESPSQENDHLMMKGARVQENGKNQDCSGGIVPWYPSGLVWQWDNLNRVAIKKDKRFAKLKQFLIAEDIRGAVIRQEAASMIPPLFMDLHPDHLVLDMCAAPGSKTSQILDTLARSEELHTLDPPREFHGGVIANEIDSKRASMLTHQLQRLGLPIAVTCCDAAVFPSFYRKVDNSNPEAKRELLQFDRILADVPCSGDGTLRKQPDIWKSWTVTGGMSLHGKQGAILRRGLELLKVGGRIVYSTCSLNPIENEAVIASVVSQLSPHVELLSPPPISGLHSSPGMKTWRVADPRANSTYLNQDPDVPLEFYKSFDDVPSDRRAVLRPSMFPPVNHDIPLERCMRIFPHQNNTGGFFVAVLVKHSAFFVDADRSCSEPSSAEAPIVPESSSSPAQSEAAQPNAPENSTSKTETTTREPSTVSDISTRNPSVKRRRRGDDPTGLHAHTFELVDASKSDLTTMWNYFGFHLSNPMEWNREKALKGPTPCDRFDLRWLATEGEFKIVQSTQPSVSSYNGMSVNLTNEPTLSAKECLSVFGPRPPNERLPLESLAFREHTDRRLYYLSSAVQNVVANFEGPKNFKWVSLGIRVLERLDTKQKERYQGCQWRLTQDGLLSVIPYIRHRIVYVNLTLAYPLLTGDRTVSGVEVLEAEAKGQIFNLGSCRDVNSDAFSQFLPGSLVIVVVPPTLIPTLGHFPDAVAVIPPPPTPENAPKTECPEQLPSSQCVNDTESSLNAAMPVRQPKPPREFNTDFPHTNSAFRHGTLKDAVPIACLLTKAGTLLPYISKDEAAGILVHLFGPSDSA